MSNRRTTWKVPHAYTNPVKTTTAATMPNIVVEEKPASYYVWLVGAPFLVVVGTAGNAMAAAVMMRKRLRETTTSLFLAVLAFVDTSILYIGLLRQWAIVCKDFDIRNYAEIICKLHPFLLYALNQFQAWLLVIVSFERLIAVFLPHHSKRLCTKTSAAVSLVVSAVVVVALNAHFLWTNQYVRIRFDDYMVSYCTPFDARNDTFRRDVWPWIDFVAFSLMPFGILVSSNVAILQRVLRSQYAHRKSQHVHGNATKMTSMTAILIVVTFSFFLTTAPISIYLIQNDTMRGESTSNDGAKWVAFNLLTYTNNTINFLLYCVSGSRFRRELISMFRRKNRVVPGSQDGPTDMQNRGTMATTSFQTVQSTALRGSSFSVASRFRSQSVTLTPRNPAVAT